MELPSYFQQETQVTEYLRNFCLTHGFTHIIDDMGSVLITKGEISEGEHYPMVGAHIDTVHRVTTKHIKEDRGILTAEDDMGIQVGIGGDDLAGTAICLELLLTQPKLKVGLFIGEECGCIGSRNALTKHREFFNNVGYMIEFDGPEDYMVTQTCSGVELFEENGEFITKSKPLLQESMGKKMRFFTHPYTDVSVIKANCDFSCINISAGYFNYHSDFEYVVIEDVEKAIKLGEKMIAELGYTKYVYKNEIKHIQYYS
jgi:putative aminopeptidase FrvX